MASSGLILGTKTTKSVTLSFSIPYYTQWGQNLMVCGSEPLLGSWDTKKGLRLSPNHQGDELIWSGSVGVPHGFLCEYRYYVVDDEKNILRSEAGRKRKLSIPEGIQEKEVVEFHDLWQNGSDDLPFKSAFKNVIFRETSNRQIERPLGIIKSNLEEKDSIVVHFRICCLSIEDETSIYVIGSSAKLGQWKVQDGLKLNYAGESTWQADCLMQKDDFPIKYPFSVFSVLPGMQLL